MPISQHQVPVDPLDFATTDALTLYFDITKTFGNGVKLKNQTFYDSQDHTNYSSYGFTADYVAMAFENKPSFEFSASPADRARIDSVFGFSYRYSDGDQRESRGRGLQVLDRRDISVPGTANERFERLGAGNVPYHWRQIGDLSDTGLFGLVDGKYGKFGAIASAFYDRYDATTFGTEWGGNYATASDSDTALTYNISLTAEVTGTINT